MFKDDTGVRFALARAVADRQVNAEAIDKVTAHLEKFEHKLRGVNPCIYGICLDFLVERHEIDDLLTRATEVGRLGAFRVFPWGIPWPDIFHVQVEERFEEIPDAVASVKH